MFEIPEAKRVRRSELYSPASSRESSVDEDATARLRASFAFETSTSMDELTEDTVDAIHENVQDDEEDEVAFRLFAPTKSANQNTTAQVIRIRSPTPIDREPGFEHPGRPTDYYFTGELDGKKKTEYELAAVTGSEVLQRSHWYCPGFIKPWRTLVIPRNQAKQALLTERLFARLLPASTADDIAKRRTRLGKKSRIKKRQKLAIKKEKDQEKAVAVEAKERADREKKAKRNRDKKFKKRARDKAKKLAETEGGGGEVAVEDEASVSGSDG